VSKCEVRRWAQRGAPVANRAPTHWRLISDLCPGAFDRLAKGIAGHINTSTTSFDEIARPNDKAPKVKLLKRQAH
jgi:hypothetical protein